MITLQELTNTPTSESFDLVVQDLSSTEVRIHYTEKALHLLKKGGLIVFDDMHKIDYRAALLRKLRPKRVTVYSLKELTLDAYQRYAFALVMNA
jgi:predicted O-methyltransferase YrrM